MPFLGVFVLMSGLWDLKDIRKSRQSGSKNKLVSENSVTRAHENCSFRVPRGIYSHNCGCMLPAGADGCYFPIETGRKHTTKQTSCQAIKQSVLFSDQCSLRVSHVRSARALHARRVCEERKTNKQQQQKKCSISIPGSF